MLSLKEGMVVVDMLDFDAAGGWGREEKKREWTAQEGVPGVSPPVSAEFII